MAKNRMINTKFWEDEFVASLEPLDRYLFLYLLTSPFTNLLGIYELPKHRLLFDTGLSDAQVQDSFKKLTEAKRAYYHEGFVVLPNFQRHQKNKGEKIEKAILDALDKLPENIKNFIRGIKLNINSNINIQYQLEVSKGIDTLSIDHKYPINKPTKNTKCGYCGSFGGKHNEWCQLYKSKQ